MKIEKIMKLEYNWIRIEERDSIKIELVDWNKTMKL